jgi:hypothetical protein
MKRTYLLVWQLLLCALLLCALFACSQDSTPSADVHRSPSTPAPAERDSLFVIDPRLLEASSHPRPEAKDTRSAAEVATEACTAADGSWRCPKLVRPRAFGPSPIIPKSWTVPAWVIDPSNVSGTASDFNDCTTAATACVTYAEIAEHRWQTYSPRIGRATTITFLSSQATNSDPVYLTPYLEGATFVVQGQLTATQQVTSGMLANTTAKNRATPQLLQTQSGATAVNQLVVNTNPAHPSRAWTSKVVGGGVFAMSQPVNPVTVPSALVAATSNNGWVNTDTVTVYAPSTIFVGQIAPVIDQLSAGLTNIGLFVYQLTIGSPTNGGFVLVNPQVSFVDSLALGTVLMGGPVRQGFAVAQVDTVFTNFQGGSSNGILPMIAGRWDFGFANAVALSNDIVLGIGSSSLAVGGASQSSLAAFYVDTGASLNVTLSAQTATLGGDSLVFWGPGTLSMRGSARIGYPAGAGAAAAAFLGTALKSNNQGTVCLAAPGAATSYGTCNLSLTAAQLDTSLGATTGCLGTGGGGSYCNFGP